MGDYNRSCTSLFEIYASNNLHFAELTLKSCAYKYTGAGVNLDLTVQLGGETLTEGTDYTISYYDENYDQTETTPTEPGIYEAYVEGMDPSYTGSSEDSFWFIIYSDKEVEFTIPFEITVEKGGAAEPPEHLFEMDYYWWPGVDTDTEEMLELISVEGNSFTLSGAGTYENEITYKGSPEILRYIFDGNEIRLADKPRRPTRQTLPQRIRTQELMVLPVLLISLTAKQKTAVLLRPATIWIFFSLQEYSYSRQREL